MLDFVRRRRRTNASRDAFAGGLCLIALAGCSHTTKSATPPSTAAVPVPASTLTAPTTSIPVPPTSTGFAATTAARAAAPTDDQIAREIARTHEANDPTEHFADTAPLAVSDGRGGYLTAVATARTPSADGHGSLVFFWHNQTFLGWDTNQEAWNVKLRTSGTNAIAATYPNYASGDPACCPSLAPVTVTYSWNGAGLAQSRPLPNGAIVGITVANS